MDHVTRPTPQVAAAMLDSIEHLTEVALRRGLPSRRFAASVSLWVGAMAAATAYDGPVANGGIAVLAVVGLVGLARWRRSIEAQVRNVHGVVGAVITFAVIVALLVIGMIGARAFEVYNLPWLPFASGGVVGTVLFVTLEIWRRRTRARHIR